MKKSEFKNLKILFVEDDEALLDALKSAIGKYFFSFLSAKMPMRGWRYFIPTTPSRSPWRDSKNVIASFHP